MNNRTCAVIAVVTLMALSSGCGGTRNFLFGRGARCGLCNRSASPCGDSMPAPCAQSAPYLAPPSPECGDQYYGARHGGCGCGGDSTYGGVANGYGPVVTDPYMSGEIVDGTTIPYQEQIIGSQVYPGSTVPIQPDDFNARKFDSDGNRILWEAPMPQGATAL